MNKLNKVTAKNAMRKSVDRIATGLEELLLDLVDKLDDESVFSAADKITDEIVEVINRAKKEYGLWSVEDRIYAIAEKDIRLGIFLKYAYEHQSRAEVDDKKFTTVYQLEYFPIIHSIEKLFKQYAEFEQVQGRSIFENTYYVRFSDFKKCLEIIEKELDKNDNVC